MRMKEIIVSLKKRNKAMREKSRYSASVGHGAGLSGFTGSLIDLLTAGHPGKAVTYGVDRAGFAKNPAALRQAYQSHPAAIDDYMREINLDKIIAQSFNGKTKAVKSRVPAFTVGAIAGASGLFLFNKYIK
jgi:hypothetical protein